jgi:peptide/nickel transport system permease protein
MLSYIIRRILLIIPLLAAISIIVFVIIQLPPGDYMTYYIMQLKQAGTQVAEEEIQALRLMFGLDRPMWMQYLIWVRNMFRGNFGISFSYQRPVSELLAERVPLTVAVSLLTTAFVYAVAVPIGIYSATHQYSFFDYLWTFVGFIGVATPGFLLALVFIWFAFSRFGITVMGLFSQEYQGQPFTMAKLLDMLTHVWVPVILIGLSGTAGLIRVMRGMTLDELNRQYVITARAKGLKETRLLFKYPVRVAINPIVSTIGWMLPGIISGEQLVSMVMNIPTTGPLMLGALLNQDMFLAGSIVFILSVLTVIGTVISDVLLLWLDPRIRFE